MDNKHSIELKINCSSLFDIIEMLQMRNKMMACVPEAGIKGMDK